MRLRANELGWAGRETLDLYCRSKAKLQAIDDWFEAGNPLINAEGQPAAILKTYWVAANSCVRQLEALRGVVRSLAAEDRDMASALAQLDREAEA